jgi:cystathionine beta-lyase
MTSSVNFDTLINRGNSDSVKWGRYKGTDILPMWVADSDFCVAPVIAEALKRRIEHGVFGYAKASRELIEIVVERMLRLYQWAIKPEWLVWQPGVVNGLNLACRIVGSSGDGVFTPSVVYPPFTDAAELSARTLRPVPMIQSDLRWVIDMEWLAQNISSDDRLLLLCNPHNPGGSVYNQQELNYLAELIVTRDLVVCADEIHCDLILDADKKHIPIASLNKEIEARSITLMAPSKTFNTPGLGCSFAIIPNRELRRQYKKAKQGIVPYVNALGYVAAQAAYQSGDDWNQQQVTYLRANRDYLLHEINAIRGLKLDSVEATYLAWIDISELGLKNPAKFFEQAGVGLSAGGEFGDDRFMRMNFGCPRSLVEEAVTRIRLAVSDYWAS